MSQVVQCPSCEKKLKIPDERAGTAIKCPGCGKPFRTKKPAPKPVDDEFDDLLEDDDLRAAPMPGKPGQAARKKRIAASDYPIKPFLKKWMLVVGGVCGLAFLVALGGFASEAVALGAAIFCVVAVIGFVAVGRTWMSIDLGRDRLWLGLVSFFVPLVGLAISARDKGPSLRGASVYISALAPALLGLLITSIFQPMYSGSGRAASRVSRAEIRLEQIESRVRGDEPIETVTYRVNGNLAAHANLASDLDSWLDDYSFYEAGSATFDSTAKTVTLRCRGGRVAHLAIAMFAAAKTKLSFQPPVPGRPIGIAVP